MDSTSDLHDDSTSGHPPTVPFETLATEQPAGEVAATESLDHDAAEQGSDPESPMVQKRVALVGRFGGVNKREATNLIRSYGAIVVELDDFHLDWIVIGADEPPLNHSELLPPDLIESAARGDIRILCETDLWNELGLVELEQSVRQYHTPAMLAELVGVDVRVIRRWQRLGLITPVQTMHKLPYFDFGEVATARRLAQWIDAGASPVTIERRLMQWMEILPSIGRPLDQLTILVEGKDVLLRHGNGLVDHGGQLRFDFERCESVEVSPESDLERESIFPIECREEADSYQSLVHDDLLLEAYRAEDAEEWEAAIDLYHAVLARDGPRADINFQIAELLYRQGHLVAARERYYMAIELDPELVEARASLGAVLMQIGQYELAIAAFRGTLSLHEEYADVHYNLAKTLDRLEKRDEANHHWRRFLKLAPESPWASETRQRLRETRGE